MSTLRIWPVGSPVSRRDDDHRNPLAVLFWDAAVLLWLLDQDQHLEVTARFYRWGSSSWRRAQAPCLATSVASAAAALSACS